MKYDAITIGYGQGAHSIALALAAKGQKVAMVEKDENNYGGSCINIGCIPTKILEHDAREGQDYVKAVERRNEVIRKKRQIEKEEMTENDNIDLYTGPASFLDNQRIQVETKEETVELTADQIFISTGSEPVFPPIDGLEEADNIYTSTTLQTEKNLPKSLGIIGGGNIGLEFASIYATYGSEVTIFETADTFMEKEEPEVAAEVQKVLEDKGVTIHIGKNVEKVSNTDGQVIAATDDGKNYRFEALLVAAGRKPHTSSLKLDNTDIEWKENGGIKVDNRLHTTVDGVYALGDVKGDEMFTYITTKDAEIILDELLKDGEKTLVQRENVPYSIFIDPSFARVGLTEKEAKEQGFTVLTNTANVGSTVRASVINDERGLYKAVVDKDARRILGVTLFGDQAHELVNFVKLAMDNDLDYTVLRDQMMTHPVMSEIFNSLFDM